MSATIAANNPGQPVTISDVIDLGVIVRAAQGSHLVARVVDDRTLVGTARSIGTYEGQAAHGADVRGQYLRVTLSGGFDAYWMVSELMRDVAEGTFVVDPVLRPGM